MLTALLILQIVTVLVVIFLLLRKPPAPQQDPRLAQLPDQLTRVDARAEALDASVRNALESIRRDLAAEASASREAGATAAAALRTEITTSIATLGQTLQNGLGSFREDNKSAATALTQSVHQQLEALSQRLTAFTNETTQQHTSLRESLNAKLNELMAGNTALQNQLREAVEQRLDQLNTTNAAKLEEMRVTVDEKLHSTLQTRLTESFGQVTDQLTKVHAGLGEMTKLSAGVDDLSRIFTNVKSRGGIGELALEMLLKDKLAPSQYIHNAKVKPNSQEVVEFAVRFPTPNGEMLLPIDSKFPREVFERLEAAYASGNDVLSAGRAFEAAIRFEGKKISDKYIAPPFTTSFAIMFLPTEGLYAEVIRRDGLMTDIQQSCQVTIAGPSTLSAILTSFQMGFHMLQMQEKGDEVWKVLANARKEFGTFEKLMDKMTDDVGKVQGTIDKLGVRTRAINRTLREVGEADTSNNLIAFEEGGAVLPLLAANDDE